MLKIDPEFRDLIPPMAAEELQQLEANIVRDGCREAIVEWAEMGIILDGHNRYAICTKHGLTYRTDKRSFTSRDDAKIWVIESQCFYRNRGLGECSDEVDVDHLIPSSKNGSDELENVVIACATHNRSRGARTIEEYLATGTARITPGGAT